MGSLMAVGLLALLAGSHLAPGTFLVLILVRGWVDLSAIVRLEILGQFKNAIFSSGIESATIVSQPSRASVLQATHPKQGHYNYKLYIKNYNSDFQNPVILGTGRHRQCIATGPRGCFL
jgi:hypothetical protein